MKRIKEVHINNFKFFPDSEPIKIDGKNILLYGENGSGKSSFYWALYTLSECSQKTDPEQIKKYFNKLNPQLRDCQATLPVPPMREVIAITQAWQRVCLSNCAIKPTDNQVDEEEHRSDNISLAKTARNSFN